MNEVGWVGMTKGRRWVSGVGGVEGSKVQWSTRADVGRGPVRARRRRMASDQVRSRGRGRRERWNEQRVRLVENDCVLRLSSKSS